MEMVLIYLFGLFTGIALAVCLAKTTAKPENSSSENLDKSDDSE
jgi:hypothetical protein